MSTTLTATTPAPNAAPAEPQPLTVVIADDHPLFRQGIARAIDRHTALRVVGEATDGREALTLIQALEPDVAVLDHRMPQLTGVEVCAHLALLPERPSTAVLLLSAFEDTDIVASAVDAGAAGYIGKTAPQAAIIDAMLAVGQRRIAYAGQAIDGFNAAMRRRMRGSAP